MLIVAPTLSLLFAACSPGKITLDTASIDTEELATGTIDTADSDGSDDTAETLDTSAPGETGETDEPELPDAVWCLNFEDGTLEAAGYDDSDFIELWDGALVFNAAEGDDFSALNGEESIAFHDDRALGLRSSHDGDVDSLAIATTPLFEVVEPALFWWVLNEVDERGIYLGIDVMTEDGIVLGSAELPPVTGGHVPGLEPEHDPIDGFPEIVEGPGTPGTLTAQQVDLSAYDGQVVKMRIYQHTRQQNQGFFTLFDDLCHGEVLTDISVAVLGDPLDHEKLLARSSR